MDYKKKWTSLIKSIQDRSPKNGLKVSLSKPLQKKDILKIDRLFKPHFGVVSFQPPPSYRDFFTICSSLKIKTKKVYYPGTEYQSVSWETVFEVYNPPKAAKQTRATVFVPKGVSYEKGIISTNHLIGFAATEHSPECTWCFDVDRVGAKGEYPVVFHDQDSPFSALYLESGKRVDEKHAKIAFKDFFAWFAETTEKLLAPSGVKKRK